MLIGKGNRVAHADRLLQVFRFVRTEQESDRSQAWRSGVDVTQHLGFCSIAQSLIARDIQLRAQLFSLIAIKNAQRNAHARAKRIDGQMDCWWTSCAYTMR